jgi:hypothetical protein
MAADEREPDDIVATGIPHSDFGVTECCGCLVGIRGGSQISPATNVARLLRTVTVGDVWRALDQNGTGMVVTADFGARLVRRVRRVAVAALDASVTGDT